MKVAVLALFLVGCILADHHTDQDHDVRAKEWAMKALDTNGDDLHTCHSEVDCAGKTHPVHGDTSKCNMVTHICGSPHHPEPKIVQNDCTSDGDCKPTFRCKDSKCHWTGPKHCAADQDCLQGTSATYECKQHNKGAPGKKCYAKCSTDQDCYECQDGTCRIPPEMQSKISCCHGNCHKKIAC